MHLISRSTAVLLLGLGVSICAAEAVASAILLVRPRFPADNVWNVRVDTLPADVNSNAYVTTIGGNKTLHPDFGTVYNGAPNGIPFVVVPGSQPRVPVSFDYADESDPGPYPIPPDAPIEGGPQGDGDRHILIVDRDAGVLYELFAAQPNSDGSWHAGSGAVFDLTSDALRPAGWTSADAAGLPILPGLVRYEEVLAGEIDHALRFTAPQTRSSYIWPARHSASNLSGTSYPPLGQRFRLKASVDISTFGPNVQRILRALKTYGMFLADNGSSWFLSGSPDPRWDDDELHQLSLLHGSDFEAVDESSLMLDPNSGRTKSTPSALSSAIDVVEFHGPNRDDYFLASDGNEISALDSGLIAGWSRTGERFRAYASTVTSEMHHAPVCRFYGLPSAGLSTHFFTAFAEECALLADRFADAWLLESPNAFELDLPDFVDGSCAEGTVPVYRIYSNRADSYHRYTISPDIKTRMISAGWIAEGFGPDAVAMCAPAQ